MKQIYQMYCENQNKGILTNSTTFIMKTKWGKMKQTYD